RTIRALPSHTVAQRHCDDPLEVGEIEWLVDISERAELEGLPSEPGVGIPANHDYSGSRIDRTDSFEQFDAVRPGQRDVEQNQLGSREDRELQALIARQGTEDTVALCSETSMDDVDHIRVVVDYKNPAGWRCRRHGCGPSSSESLYFRTVIAGSLFDSSFSGHCHGSRESHPLQRLLKLLRRCSACLGPILV